MSGHWPCLRHAIGHDFAPACQRQQPKACTICTKATSNARLPASDSSQMPARYAPKPRAMHACQPPTAAKSLHEMHQSHEQCTHANQRQQPNACTKCTKATSDARMPISDSSQMPARNAPKARAMRACQPPTTAKSLHETHQSHEQCAHASQRQAQTSLSPRILLPAPSPLSVCPLLAIVTKEWVSLGTRQNIRTKTGRHLTMSTLPMSAGISRRIMLFLYFPLSGGYFELDVICYLLCLLSVIYLIIIYTNFEYSIKFGSKNSSQNQSFPN